MARQIYQEISQWGEPYEGGVFDRNYMGSVGSTGFFSGSVLGDDQIPMSTAETTGAPGPAAEPTDPTPIVPTGPGPTLPEVTVYGQCDFSQGKWVEAIQAGLITKGKLAPGDAASEKGYFGEKTCAAWTALTGQKPDIASIASSVLGPNESCASFVVPACAAEKQTASMGYGKMALYGIGLIGLVVVAERLLRRKR